MATRTLKDAKVFTWDNFNGFMKTLGTFTTVHSISCFVFPLSKYLTSYSKKVCKIKTGQKKYDRPGLPYLVAV